MSTKKVQMFGFKFLTPVQDAEYQPEVTVPANVMVNYAELTGDINISLGAGQLGYDNQWLFTITQGATAYTVTLPTISWALGIAPVFSANTAIEVRLHKNKTGVYTGVWSPC